MSAREKIFHVSEVVVQGGRDRQVIRTNGDIILEYANGGIFLMAEDGRSVPAPRCAPTEHTEGDR